MFRYTSDSPPSLPEVVMAGPLFGEVPRPGREAFLKSLAFLSADPKTELFTEGEPGDTLWVVLRGAVTLTRLTDAGEAVELDRAGPGDVFGEMAVISPALRTATARTVEESDLLVLTRSRFRQLLGERDAAAEALMRYVTFRICRRLRQTDARIGLVHDALQGADPQQVATRIAELQRLGRYP